MIAADAEYIAHLSVGSGGGGFAVGLPGDEPGCTIVLLYVFPDMFQKGKVHAWLKGASAHLCQGLSGGRSSHASYALLHSVV